MKKAFGLHYARLIAMSAAIAMITTSCEKNDDDDGGHSSTLVPDSGNAGLTLPGGFGALTVSGETGAARHITVNTNGDVYVKLSELKNGNGILVLKDNNNDGRADSETGFGNFPGTGIAIRDGFLYASSDDAIFRYKLNANNEVENPAAAETIVSGLTKGIQHTSKSIALDNQQNIYVNIGAPSNASVSLTPRRSINT